MKKLLVIATVSLLTGSCNQSELDRANFQRDSLMTALKSRDSDLDKKEETLNEFISSFNEVERNLDSVAKRQQIIIAATDKSNGDLKAAQKERINSQISAINELMENNRRTIADLRKRLSNSGRKNKKLEETVATLTDQLSQKDMELTALNERLNALNAQVAQLQTSVDTLTAQNEANNKTIAENITVLHTAYYIVGKTKELRDAKVIDKKGGLLGIGKTSGLSQDFDQSKFTKIDYTKVTSIPVNSDKVKIITNHPTDSYRLERDSKDKDVVKNMVITNPEKFWSVSKYLVIEGMPKAVDNTLSNKNQSRKDKI